MWVIILLEGIITSSIFLVGFLTELCLYSNHLNTGLVWYSNGQKVVRFANGLVFEWHLNTRQKSPVFKWLGCVITIIMLRNCHSYVLPFEYRTLKSLVFRWIRYSGVRYSDGYCILLSGNLIPTVLIFFSVHVQSFFAMPSNECNLPDPVFYQCLFFSEGSHF